MRKVRTARGEVVDFDELRIKQSMGANPPNIQVQARTEYVDLRLKRKSKRRAHAISAQMIADHQASEEQTVEASDDVVSDVVEVVEPVETTDVEPVIKRKTKPGTSNE